MSKTKDGVTVEARGAAVAPYDLVVYKLQVSSVPCSTGIQAKANITETTEKIQAYVSALIREDMARNHVFSLHIEPYIAYENNNRVHRGYKAIFKLKFESLRVDLVSQIQDVLTSYEQTVADVPTFGFVDSADLFRKALENAWASVKERWEFECELLLGLDEVGSKFYFSLEDWNVDYGPEKQFSKVAAPTSDSVGLGMVELRLSTRWRRKPI